MRNELGHVPVSTKASELLLYLDAEQAEFHSRAELEQMTLLGFIAVTTTDAQKTNKGATHVVGL